MLNNLTSIIQAQQSFLTTTSILCHVLLLFQLLFLLTIEKVDEVLDHSFMGQGLISKSLLLFIIQIELANYCSHNDFYRSKYRPYRLELHEDNSSRENLSLSDIVACVSSQSRLSHTIQAQDWYNSLLFCEEALQKLWHVFFAMLMHFYFSWYTFDLIVIWETLPSSFFEIWHQWLTLMFLFFLSTRIEKTYLSIFF